LKANLTVFREIRVGVSWLDLHLIAENIILAGLIELGILKGDLKEMQEKRVIYYFMPHGLGHYLGIYVHDLPGLKEKEKDKVLPDKINIRINRKLEEGMVMTNEPGCYFNT